MIGTHHDKVAKFSFLRSKVIFIFTLAFITSPGINLVQKRSKSLLSHFTLIFILTEHENSEALQTSAKHFGNLRNKSVSGKKDSLTVWKYSATQSV